MKISSLEIMFFSQGIFPCLQCHLGWEGVDVKTLIQAPMQKQILEGKSDTVAEIPVVSAA